MVLRSSDREKPLPGARINLGPAPTATTSSTGEAKVGVGRRGRILHLGPPDPAPIPPPRRPDPRNTLTKPRDRKPPPPPPPRSPAPPKAAVAPPRPKVRQRFDLPAFAARVKQVEAQRTRLHREIEERERLVREAERSLERRDWPVIGLLTRRSQEAIEERLAALVDELDALYGQLEEAVVDADFEVDARAQALFAELTQRFDRLQPIGSGQAPSGASSRAPMPRNSDQHQPVTLDLMTSPTRPLRLQHGHDNALFVFPRFVAAVGCVGGCGLHDIRDLFVSARAATSANDVGELLLTLPTGFDEAYRFRHVAACEAFADAFATYLDALPPLPPVVTPAVARPQPPSGAQPQPVSRPAPTHNVVTAPQPIPVNAERPAPPDLRAAPLPTPPSSSRGTAIASPPAPSDAERPLVRLVPLPKGLMPTSEDPFVAPAVRQQNVTEQPAPQGGDNHPRNTEPAAPPVVPDPEPARQLAPAPHLHAANDSIALPIGTATAEPADQAPPPPQDQPLPAGSTPPIIEPGSPAVGIAASTAPEPVQHDAPRLTPDALALTPAASVQPAVERATPTVESVAPIASPLDTTAKVERDSRLTPDEAAATPTASALPIVEQIAPAVEPVAPIASPLAATPEVEWDGGPTPDAAAAPTEPALPIIEQIAPAAEPVAPITSPLDATRKMDPDGGPMPDAAAAPTQSALPIVEQIASAVEAVAPTTPAQDASPTGKQDTLRRTPDAAATTSVDPPLAPTAPAGIPSDPVPTQSAAPKPDRDPGPAPDALTPPPVSIRWDVATSSPAPEAPALINEGPHHAAPQRDNTPLPPTAPPSVPAPPQAAPVRPTLRWREPIVDEGTAHWSEPLSRLHIPVWPPIEPPPAPRRAPLDDETVQHWSEPVSLIKVPAWPALGTAPAASAAAPAAPPASVRLSAAARATVDAVIANSRAGLHTSARVGAAGLAAVTTYIGDVRTSVANRRSQRRVAPAEPLSVRIRPSRLSVPLPIASLLSKRAWRWSAALTALAVAIAATSPFLWRQHTEPTVAASSPPPLPPLPPSPAAPVSAPTLPPAPAAPQPKAEIPSPPRPAPRESRPLTGIEVIQLQGRLRALGFNPGPADGVIGPRTVTAAREFQAAHGLAVTGTIDSALFDDVSVAQAKTMKPSGTR